MGDLVRSGQGEEASALDELSEQQSEILAKYGLLVTAVLDHMEGMLLGQVRKVIRAFWPSWLGGGNGGGGGGIQDQLSQDSI